MRGLKPALIGLLALLAAPSGLRAAEPSPVWKDGWTINTPGHSNWVSDGTPSLVRLRRAPPSTAYTPGLAKDPYGFADYSLGHTLRFGNDYGLGNMQATLGVRMAEPLASNGFTPSFDPRRYMGVGPRLGLEGNSPLPSSWVVEWKVGASVLYTDRGFDRQRGVVNPALPNFANTGSMRQCRWPAGPVVLVRQRLEADARLSRRLFQRRLADLQHLGQRRPTARTASITVRWSASRSRNKTRALFVRGGALRQSRRLLRRVVVIGGRCRRGGRRPRSVPLAEC